MPTTSTSRAPHAPDPAPTPTPKVVEEEEDEDVTFCEILRFFFAIHWRGIVCFVAPLVCLAALAPFPPQPYQWVLYTMLVMAIFWLTECIPLEVTSFLPVFTFPIGTVMTTTAVCKCYVNDTIILLLGVLFLAFSLEQCGILQRVAYMLLSATCTSHIGMLFVIVIWTSAISSMIPNTVATAVMIPIVFNVLRIIENKSALKMYEIPPGKKEKVATDLTTGYCCAVAYSATLGGLATLTGTSTTLTFKGLYHDRYPQAPERLTYLNVIILNVVPVFLCVLFLFLYIGGIFFGMAMECADNKLSLNAAQKKAVQKAIDNEIKKLGPFKCKEWLTPLLFFMAMALLLTRYPLFFDGWGPLLAEELKQTDPAFVQDSSIIICMCVLMFIVPGSLDLFKNFTAKVQEDMPKTPVQSVMHWPALNSAVPFSFIFLLGAGIALQHGSRVSGLDGRIFKLLADAKDLPAELLIFLIMLVVTIVTNFSSNVIVANLACPLAMIMAEGLTNASPLWFCMAAGYAASFAFILPIGAPGNLLVYRKAKIPLCKMMIAGVGPTIFTLLLYYGLITFGAPILFNLNGYDYMPYLDKY